MRSSQARQGLTVCADNFVHENTGNIKEYYKISSCIGRGKGELGIQTGS